MIGPLLETLSATLTQDRLLLVERAYTVAAYWHRDQRRRSGDPYITHPVAVAMIVAELDPDHEMVCAALLHDVLEDTACPQSLLAEEFGEPIAGLVRELTALNVHEDPASCTDERVLTLKLCDRLHNLRTIRFVPADKQRAKSRQSLEVFVPVARRLGLTAVETELADLARRTLSPTAETSIGGPYQALAVAALLLPGAERARWLEEWLGILQTLGTPRDRLRFTLGLLAGIPRMALTRRRLRAWLRRRG